jgi:hypothetical protein
MSYSINGISFDMVAQDKMTPAEIDAVERVTGLTFTKISRLGQTCVCEHSLTVTHIHKDAEGTVVRENTACVACDCDQFWPDLPTRVTTAFIWVSAKRAIPTITFEEVGAIPLDALGDDAAQAVVAVDPTQPPPVEA